MEIKSVERFLGSPNRWKDLCDFMPRLSGRGSATYPQLEDVASMLEALSAGLCRPLLKPIHLAELGWDLSDLRVAVERLNIRKCGNEFGLTAASLKNMPGASQKRC